MPKHETVKNISPNEILKCIKTIPNRYNGDFCCVVPRYPYKWGRSINPPTDGHAAWEVVNPGNKKVGVIEEWFESNGVGKLSFSRFYEVGKILEIPVTPMEIWAALGRAAHWMGVESAYFHFLGEELFDRLYPTDDQVEMFIDVLKEKFAENK